MDRKESKGEWTAWVVGLSPAKPDREPGGLEDRRAPEQRCLGTAESREDGW